MFIGYARVSTPDQSLDLQKDALTKAGCQETFKDVASGAKSSRSGLDQALSNTSALVTPLLFGGWIAWAGYSVTLWTLWLAFKNVGLACGHCKRTSTPRPPVENCSCMFLALSPSLSGSLSGSAPLLGSKPPLSAAVKVVDRG